MSSPDTTLDGQGQLPQMSSDSAVAILSGGLSTGSSTLAVSSARDVLAKSISTEKIALVNAIASQHLQIESHLARGEQLIASSSQLHSNSNAVERDFHADKPESTPVLSDLLALVGERQSASANLSEALATTEALKSATKRYSQLRAAEDALWSGHGANQSTLELVRVDPTTSTSSKIEAEIIARIEHLRTLVSDQLATAWGNAVAVGEQTEGLPAVSVKRTIHLQRPKAPRSTPTSDQSISPASPPYTATEVGQALEQLKVLPALLQDLQSRIIRNVVEYLVTEHNLTVAQLDEAERAVFVIKRGPQTRPVDVVSNVRSALKFVGEQVLPSSGLEGREGFLLSLGRAAFQLILDKVLIPSMPHSLDGISDWLQLVRKSAEWEQELCSSPDSPGMLQQFLQIGAGKAWLDQRRVDTLRQTRHLVYHDWKTWNSKSVDDLFETVSPQEVPLGEVSSNGKAAAQETDGMATDQNSDMADDDGWNFDDFEVVTSQPVRAPTKPVREAKRLGRKAAQKSLAPEQRIGAEDSEVEPAPVKPASHQPANNPASIPPASEKKTYQVSVICDRVVAVVSDAVGDMKRLADLLPTEAAFKNVSEGISQQLGEALDMVRATVPVVYSSRLQSAPALALQLSNDFQYIGKQLASHNSDRLWSARSEYVNRFSSAASLAYDTCIEEQVAGNSLLLHAADFADCSNDSTFTSTAAVVEEVVLRIKAFAAAISPVVSRQRYNVAVGRTVESLADILLDRILGLEDITEVESERLGTMLSEVEQLDQLFTLPNSTSTIAGFVPLWLKLCYTNQLLRANLADIGYLFETGSLVDFRVQELARLVRALFADSPKRAALLEKVEKGLNESH